MSDTIEVHQTAAVTDAPLHRYVVGFLFDSLFTRVALIRKLKPEWQYGLLNGIGGKIEPGEDSESAMRREFGEEASYPAPSELAWKRFCVMSGTNNGGGTFHIDFFYSIGTPNWALSREEEKVEAHNVTDVAGGWEETLGNVPWLVGLARDCGMNRFPPTAVSVRYGK